MKFTIDPTLREVPDSYEAWTQLGVAARMLGELDLAERALTKALQHVHAAMALREGCDPELVESTRVAITAAAARCS